MLWSEGIRRGLTAVLAASLLTAAGACGFRPLYADKPEGGNVSQSLASVYIAEPADRLHQLVRNELLRGGLSQSQGVALYKLDILVQEQDAGLLVRRSTLVDRQVMTLNMAFKLRDGKEKPVFEGKNAVKVSYNRTVSEFNNLRAKKDARERAAKRIAQILQTRLAAWLSQNSPKS